jgi:hypothetical protein
VSTATTVRPGDSSIHSAAASVLERPSGYAYVSPASTIADQNG